MHANAEAVQRLAQFEADDSGPENGDALGQVDPIEDVVVDDQSVPQLVPRFRVRRR